jgi:hypothetical protein
VTCRDHGRGGQHIQTGQHIQNGQYIWNVAIPSGTFVADGRTLARFPEAPKLRNGNRLRKAEYGKSAPKLPFWLATGLWQRLFPVGMAAT